MAELTMDKLVALCKNRGFIFAGSEIYGGLANTWDFGPLGVEYKNNVKKAWWLKFVQQSPYNTGLDCAILMNREVWVASGHVGGFNDPMMDCKACKARFRADKLIEDFTGGAETGDGWSNAELEQYIAEHDIVCPVCGKKDFTGIRQFNLMFKTRAGVNDDSAAEIYLRPETAQGIFVNFLNDMRTTRKKLPAGICQIGKSSSALDQPSPVSAPPVKSSISLSARKRALQALQSISGSLKPPTWPEATHTSRFIRMAQSRPVLYLLS